MDYCSKVIKLEGNVAKNKNKALKTSLKTENDYFFLIEENCKVKDDKVFDKFIKASEKTGIEALMWPREELNKKHPFDEDEYIEYWADFVSSFMMFTRNAVETVGFFDEDMPENTWQDLEYVKRIGDAGLSTPFGMFAAPKNVEKYFEIIAPNDSKDTLKLDKGLEYWSRKAGEDFPINIVKESREMQQQGPITEMI